MKNVFKTITTLLFLAIATMSYTIAQSYIAANDAKIHYTGRIDFSNPLQPQYAFPGVSIQARFNGTGVRAIIHDYGTGTAGTINFYKVFIDGTITTEQLQVTNGEATYDLATGLGLGDHTVEIMKITEGASGKSSFIGFQVIGGSQTSLDLPAKPNKRIEFIGDSWTCGYGNLSQFSSGNASMANSGYIAKNEDNYYAWGPLTAQSLGAEYHVTAISGRGLYRNNWHSDNTGTASGTLPKNYDNIMEDNDAIQYDHSWHPAIVVIHLGTNDMAAEGDVGQSAKLDDDAFQNTYRDFVDKILGYHPCAKVIMCFGNSKSDSYPAWTQQLSRLRTVASNIEDMYPDGNVTKLELPYTAESWPASPDDCGYGDAWHPSLCSHEEMSNKLLTKINSMTINWGTESGCTYTYNPVTAGNVTTGLFSSTFTEKVKIYPNPTQRVIQISGIDNVEWQIINQLGEVVLTATKNTINVEHLNPGIYFLKSSNSSNPFHGTFIKK